MKKSLMNPQTLVYPMPALLIGTNIDDKPNFMTVAWGGIANGDPPMISVAIRHQRHSLKGIQQNMAFSVNIPSADMVRETDYCGITSGSRVDKAEVCKFKVFYGKLLNVPLIEQCPINHECKVMHMLDLGSHSLVIGRIEETHVSESCMTNGKPDVNKIQPFAFTESQPPQYHVLGNDLAKAFSIGKELTGDNE